MTAPGHHRSQGKPSLRERRIVRRRAPRGQAIIEAVIGSEVEGDVLGGLVL
jgi:hypothetical protein